MAVTRSWTARKANAFAREKRERGPGTSLWWLAAASLLVAGGLAMVYAAKAQSFAADAARLRSGSLIDLNTVSSPEELLPALEWFSDRDRRQDAAGRMSDFLNRARPLRNVGALAALREGSARKAPPLLPLTRLKPLFTVRTPREFTIAFLKFAGLYFAGFWLVGLAWRALRFRGDRALLPPLHLLTGMGLILVVSLRDPLRDTLEFQKFAIGVFLGCLLLLLPALKPFDYMRLSDWCYTPLFGAIALFALLIVFGRGPGGSDAKVNVGPFQPVEPIKILLALFLAGRRRSTLLAPGVLSRQCDAAF